MYLEKIISTFTRDQLEKEKIKQLAKLDKSNARLAFLDEVGANEGDEKEFKAFSYLTMIENDDLTKHEKAKAIAALIAE